MEVRMDGAQLAAKRKAVKLSQQAVAERAKCSLAMVSLLERGYRPEASEVADRIARVLHDAAEAA
jgi:transcriptional regulator with XRE-family HTH domain